MSQQAENLGDVMNILQRQKQELDGKQEVEEVHQAPSGFFVAPGVRFSDRLWAKLGGKAGDADRRSRRERMTDSTALPAPRFDIEFRRDSLWKQRYEFLTPSCRLIFIACSFPKEFAALMCQHVFFFIKAAGIHMFFCARMSVV